MTGSLFAFEWLSGYRPTAEEAKILLKKTSIPTLHSFEVPQRNGHGMLNTYKLGQAAKKFKIEKAKCDEKTEEEKRKICITNIINGNDIYQFEEEAGLEQKINESFPQCNNGNSELISKTSCTEKKEALKSLRKGVLLNSDDPNKAYLWKKLSCIYKSEGFDNNAEAIDRIYLAVSGDENFLNNLAKGDRFDKINAARLAGNMKKVEILKQLSEDNDQCVKVSVVRTLKNAVGLGGWSEELQNIARNLEEGASSEVQEAINQAKQNNHWPNLSNDLLNN